MYQDLYDENHQIYKVDLTSEDYSKSKKVPTGIYDKNILCANCDTNIIGSYETYASTILYGGVMNENDKPIFQRMIDVNNVESMKVYNVDYTKFKLFLLSLLWRSSITSQILFKDVKLSIDDEENIRLMLLKGDAGDVYDYPCVILTFIRTSLHKEFFSSPRKDLAEEKIHIVIHGIIYTFIISKNNMPFDYINYSSINKNNEMALVYLDEVKAKKFMNNYFGLNLY